MANTLQTSLKKKTQQESELLYVPAQTGQKGTGSLVINSSASQPAYGYPVSNQQGSAAGNQNLAAQASPAQASAAGPNINGVSDWSKQGLVQYGQQYAPSQAVAEAQDYLQSVMSGQPGGFSSKYAGDIAALYDQIMNRPKFEYDVNRDPLFQQYKNQYTVQGQRAMQDTLGQAAGLTGGYGNSWGTTAGYQAYQYYLQQLNDRIPEMEQRAFDRYTAEGDEMRANMNMATTLDNIDYGRYRDTVADWQADRSFAAGLYANERSWDMSEWNSMRDYYTQLASLENGDYWNQENLKENARQFDADLAYRYYGADKDDAYKYAELAERSRWFDEELANKKYEYQDTKEYNIGRDAVKDEQWNKDFNQTEYWNEKNFANTEARQAEEDRRYWEGIDYRNQQEEYNRSRDEKQDAWNQKLYDQSEQHYQDSLARQDAQTQHQYEREAVEDARYDDTTAYNRSRDEKQDAWNEKLYNQSEQHYQDSLAREDARTQHQYEREAVEDARYDDTTAYNRSRDEKQDAWNQKLYDQSEQHYQDTRSDNERTYQHMLEREGIEDERYFDERDYNRGRDAVSDAQVQAALDEKIREFDLGYGLDKAQFDLTYQKYLDALEQAGLTGSSNNGGNNDSNTNADTTPEEKTNPQAVNVTDVIWPQTVDPKTGILKDPLSDKETLDAIMKSQQKQNLGTASTLTDRINSTRISNPLNTAGASAFVQQAMTNGYSKDEAEELDAIINGATAKETDAEKKEKKKKNQLATAAAARYLTEK